MKINLSKKIKFQMIGSAMLLLSFISQNFLYDYWKAKSDEFIFGQTFFADVERSSLLYLNLFFNAKLDNDSIENQVKMEWINKAAVHQAQGNMADIAWRNLDKQKKIDLINAIIQKTFSVYDFDSFLKFIEHTNNIYIDNNLKFQESVNKIEKHNQYRKYSRWVFLMLYILGTIILIYGMKYESDKYLKNNVTAKNASS